MKAITLTQPWATLVAIGAKRVETRSWRTGYRGPLAITAAKTWPHKAQMIAISSPFIERLNRAGYLPDIPLGVVVATCNLVDCLPMAAHICLPGIFDEYPDLNTSQERKFGDFDVIDQHNGRRRWAFVLEDVKQLPDLIQAKGALGLWEWTPPQASIASSDDGMAKASALDSTADKGADAQVDRERVGGESDDE